MMMVYSGSWDEASSHGSLRAVNPAIKDRIEAGKKIPNDSKQVSTRVMIIY